MYKLTTDAFHKVEPVFNELAFNVVIQSVINGNTPGEIYVDDVDHPKTAILWDMMCEVLIEGESTNPDFNRAIHGLIKEELMPRAKERYIPCFDLYYSSQFEDKADEIVPLGNYTRVGRNVYRFNALKIQWRAHIPNDCTMVRIDESFLQRTDLAYLEDVKGWINSFWHSTSDFVSKGMGYCLVLENAVVSWCLSVFVGGTAFEFGLETVAEFRGNGYGKLTAAACLEYCIQNELVPFWQCHEENVPSNIVSERIGFEKDFHYDILNFQF